MRKWLNGTDKHVPQHYSGTRPTAGRALSRTRSLTAAAIAVAMMATVAVTSLLPAYNAKADESHNGGAICTPTSISLGTDTGSGTVDSGIATYVGGDMYVGQKASSGNMNNVSGPSGSYAAEAEGLTAVNGKLLMHPLKGVWTSYYTSGTKNGYVQDYKGFRFGIVGFGGQYRPAPGSSTLEVRGNSTDNAIDWVGGAQAWGNAGWVGQIKTSEPSYTANIAGDSTTVYGGSSNDILGAPYGSQNTNKKKYDQRNSVYVPSDTNGTVNWNQNDDQIGSTGETFDGFGSYIKTLSGNLSNLSKQQSDSVYVTNAKTTHNNEDYTNLVRAKFDGTYSFTINNVHEKIIEFEGNGKSSMQVFNLPASTLNDSSSSSSYSGVSFSFKNIPDTSSVVINVTGENVDFHNGWRFWWTDTNGTTSELGGSYTDNAYAKRAQQIMWNFADASNVVIRGGQGSGSTTRNGSNSTVEGNDGVWAGSFPMQTYDDPAAGMLGSILVPNGSFESHVSTNGRVWVGGSFAMYNPDAVGNTYNGTFYSFLNYERSHSASALDMDQERHNLPWNGSYSTSCAAIAWDKVDDTAEHKALGGTSWTVYGKKEDAVTSKNALATIADGGWNDDADAEGSFQLGNLAKNGTYFLKESGTVEGYAQNTNIYQINTGSTTDAVSTIASVFDSDGNEITAEADRLLTNGKIVNKKTGSSITWQKVDGTDNNTLLAGSTWTLSKMNGNTAEQTWTITDDQSGTEVRSIKITDVNGNPVTSASFVNTTPQKFIATAYDQNGNAISGAKLSWSSSNTKVASVADGTVTPNGSGRTTITVKSADGNVQKSFTVTVSGVTVETSVSIDSYRDGQEISLEKGKTLNLIASVAPEGNTVTWSTSNADNVSLSPTTGTSVTLTANKVTSSHVIITAKETRTDKTVTLKVNVTKPPATTTTVYFKMQGDFNRNDGQMLYLEWKTSNGSWPADNGDRSNRKEMDVVNGCNDYVSYTIPQVMSTGDSFRIRRNKSNDGWNGANAFYRPDAERGFSFNGGDVVTLNSANDIRNIAPSCYASPAAAAYRSHRAIARSNEHRAVAAVLRTQSNVLNVANETTDTKKDEDTAAGKFKVSDLANGTYHLQEKTAPNGYEVSNTVYTITIANGSAIWNPAFGPDNADNKIANTRKTGAVTWTKVSSDTNNSEPLSGSEWTLKQTKAFSWADGAAKYTDVTPATTLGTVTDCVDEQNGVAECSTQTGVYVDLNGVSGKFKISGLGWGEYELVESKAPDGYDLDNTPHKFRIGPLEGGNIAGNWYANTDFNTEGTSAYNEQTTFTVNGGAIKNKPGVILPGTGGAGDYWIYAAALVAALIGVVAAGMALKVRRRQ